MKISFASIFFAILLVACGTTSSTKFDIALPKEVQFSFSDERPAEQRRSYETVDRAGQTLHLGDEALVPAPAELVRAWLDQSMGVAIAKKKVVLQKFSVNILDPKVAFNEAGVAAVGDAPTAKLIIGGISTVTSLKTVDIALQVSVDGVVFESEAARAYSGRVTEANINSAITEAFRRLEGELRGAK
jgi:hypothetical protein